MKQMKTWVLVLTVLMGIGFTSCINSDNDYTPTGGGPVEVINSIYGGTYFQDVNGLKIVPSITSLSAVEQGMNFKPTKTNMAYILFTYTEEQAAEIVNGKISNVDLKYAISIDETVESVDSKESEASNDSISTAPVIQLDNVVNYDPNKELFLWNDRFLFTGINYYFYAKMHYFTLVKYDNEQEEGKLIYHLRHTGTPEAPSVNSTSRNAGSSLPYMYYKSFDIRNDIAELDKNGPTTIEVHAEVNPLNNELSGVKPKIYTVVYDPRKEK